MGAESLGGWSMSHPRKDCGITDLGYLKALTLGGCGRVKQLKVPDLAEA
jgi:hypothetical protein